MSHDAVHAIGQVVQKLFPLATTGHLHFGKQGKQILDLVLITWFCNRLFQNWNGSFPGQCSQQPSRIYSCCSPRGSSSIDCLRLCQWSYPPVARRLPGTSRSDVGTQACGLLCHVVPFRREVRTTTRISSDIFCLWMKLK